MRHVVRRCWMCGVSPVWPVAPPARTITPPSLPYSCVAPLVALMTQPPPPSLRPPAPCDLAVVYGMAPGGFSEAVWRGVR